MEPYVKQIKKGVIRMTGYLPYLIEKHGYSEQPVIRWIEKQLKRYSNVFVTSNTDEFNIIVIGRGASYVYGEKFTQVLGVPISFDGLDMDKGIMTFKISKNDLRKFDKRWGK